MLYDYKGKIYIKPLANKIAEVKVSKKGKEFTVDIVGKLEYITPEIKKEMKPIAIDRAYKDPNKI